MRAATATGQGILAAMQGSWHGLGYINAQGVGEGRIDCAVVASFQTPRLDVNAICGGAAQGAQIDITLRYNETTGRYHGEMRGGVESGVAVLYGKEQAGDMFLRIDGSRGDRGGLMIVREADNRVRVLMTTQENGQHYTILDLPLQKQ